MPTRKWPTNLAQHYLALEQSLRTIGHMATDAATHQNVSTSAQSFMWSDAVASFLLDRFARPGQRT